MNKTYLVGLCLSLGLFASCGDIETPIGQPEPGTQIDPGTKVKEPTNENVDALLKSLQEDEGMTSVDFLDKYEVDFPGAISFVPSDADNMDLIQASALALTQTESDALDANGFVIAKSTEFPSFAHGYETIYMQDLPLFVSADSVLEAVHRSYDDILLQIELDVLIPALESLLVSMRENQTAALQGFAPDVQSDVDLYLTVALRLLADDTAQPIGNANASDVDTFVQKANDAKGMEERVIFGAKRKMDFSQFKPRGHYTDIPEMSRYFRAMMWLGRIDFRMLEPDAANNLVFHRNQFEMAIALRKTMDDTDEKSWEKIHNTIGAFVGEPDNMIVPQLDALLSELNITDTKSLSAISDQKIIDTIQDNGFGAQRISSHIMINGLYGTTKPLSSIFMLFGQRYVIDSHVFSNVVFDRVNHGKTKRMMPDPLDVAFAALGNDHAGILLTDELKKYEYAYDLHTMRKLADLHDDDYWNKNLYNMWMGSLRTLSPNRAVSPAELPAVALTANWSKRILNTQLASWAELRHDTILYAKQSYSSGASCEFPDAYVEPNPEFFLSIAEYSARGAAMIAELNLSNPEIAMYFKRTEDIARILADMANYQKSGTPYTDEMLVFINQAVTLESGCDGPTGATGWYADLFYQNSRSIEFDPVIADVHTQPTDESGNPVGKVLHVGTGNVRLMVTTIETCDGPRAYVGLASSFHQVITENFKRLDDQAWAKEVQAGTVDDPEWMKDVAVK